MADEEEYFRIPCDEEMTKDARKSLESWMNDLSEPQWFTTDAYCILAEHCLFELREKKKRGEFSNEDFEKYLTDLRRAFWPKDSKNPL